MEILTQSARETQKLGESLADNLTQIRHAEFISASPPLEILNQVQNDEIKDKKQAIVICLYGDLGSGKTTFTQGFAGGLGIKQRIVSPTFVFIRQYKIFRHAEFISASDTTNKRIPEINSGQTLKQVQDDKENTLFHIDLYRIQSLKDAKALGLEEILFDPANIIFIEWPEKIKKILPKKRTEIYFEYLKENQRRIKIKQLWHKE